LHVRYFSVRGGSRLHRQRRPRLRQCESHGLPWVLPLTEMSCKEGNRIWTDLRLLGTPEKSSHSTARVCNFAFPDDNHPPSRLLGEGPASCNHVRRSRGTFAARSQFGSSACTQICSPVDRWLLTSNSLPDRKTPNLRQRDSLQPEVSQDDRLREMLLDLYCQASSRRSVSLV